MVAMLYARLAKMNEQRVGRGEDGGFPGVVFHGEGDLDEAVAAVCTACGKQGLSTESKRRSGFVEVTARQRRSRWRVAWGHLPQRIDWRLEQRDGELRVCADFRLAPWYRRLLAGTAVVIVCMLVVGFFVGGRQAVLRSFSANLLVSALVLAALLATGWFAPALGPLGGGRRAAFLWRHVRERIAARGGHLGPIRHSMTRRYVRAMYGLMAALLVLLLWWGLAGLVRAADAGGVLLLLVLPMLISLTLLGCAAVAAGRPGTEVRVAVLLPGMATSTVAVLFLGLPLIPALLVTTGAPPRPAAARLVLILLAAGGALVLGLGTLAVTGASHFAPTLDRLRLQHRRGVDRQAVAGRAVLRVVRRAFVTLWLFLGLLLAGEMCCLSLALLTVQGLAADGMGTRLAGVWKDLWVAAAGGVVGPEAVPWLAVLPVAVAAAVGWLALGLSLGQLAAARWRLRRRLRRGCAAVGRNRQALRLERWLSQLGRRHALPGLHLAVREGAGEVDAQAHRVGVLRPRRYVEVSGVALQHLDADRLRAIVAHETGHHLAGHVTLFNRLRWLGRLTLMGDGFVQTLQHSFGYETEADRVAVTRLGVDRRTLAAALKLLQEVNAMRRLRARRPAGRDGLRAAAPPASGGAEREKAGWRGRWWRFLEQYVDPVNHHYWHPDPDERIALLVRGGEEVGT